MSILIKTKNAIRFLCIPFIAQPIYIFATLSFMVSIAVYKYHFPEWFSENHTVWAEFGNYFSGVLSPIFAFLAFLILVKTLKVTQQELSETKELLNQQKFESTFFELLKVLHEKTAHLDNDKYTQQPMVVHLQARGNALINYLADKLKKIILSAANTDNSQILLLLNGHYSGVIQRQAPTIIEFYSVFILIANFILAKNINAENESPYIDMLTTYASQEGLVLFICYALTSDSDEKFITVVEKLKLIDHVNDLAIMRCLQLALQQYQSSRLE